MGGMTKECFILTTGGTIDKVYFDAKSSYAVGDPQIEEVLRLAQVNLPYRVHSLMRKDSLEISDEDRKIIREAIESVDNQMVLVTHGTDTMAETGRFLKGIPSKTIVLTGSLQPARFRDNDAIFNIGFALAAVQALPAGVYVAMNGQFYDPDLVRKDRKNNCFVALDSPAGQPGD